MMRSIIVTAIRQPDGDRRRSHGGGGVLQGDRRAGGLRGEARRCGSRGHDRRGLAQRGPRLQEGTLANRGGRLNRVGEALTAFPASSGEA